MQSSDALSGARLRIVCLRVGATSPATFARCVAALLVGDISRVPLQDLHHVVVNAPNCISVRATLNIDVALEPPAVPVVDAEITGDHTDLFYASATSIRAVIGICDAAAHTEAQLLQLSKEFPAEAARIHRVAGPPVSGDPVARLFVVSAGEYLLEHSALFGPATRFSVHGREGSEQALQLQLQFEVVAVASALLAQIDAELATFRRLLDGIGGTDLSLPSSAAPPTSTAAAMSAPSNSSSGATAPSVSGVISNAASLASLLSGSITSAQLAAASGPRAGMLDFNLTSGLGGVSAVLSGGVRRRFHGRLHKRRGELFLMLGSPVDALDSLDRAAKSLRGTGDVFFQGLVEEVRAGAIVAQHAWNNGLRREDVPFLPDACAALRDAVALFDAAAGTPEGSNTISGGGGAGGGASSAVDVAVALGVQARIRLARYLLGYSPPKTPDAMSDCYVSEDGLLTACAGAAPEHVLHPRTGPGPFAAIDEVAGAQAAARLRAGMDAAAGSGGLGGSNYGLSALRAASAAVAESASAAAAGVFSGGGGASSSDATSPPLLLSGGGSSSTSSSASTSTPVPEFVEAIASAVSRAMGVQAPSAQARLLLLAADVLESTGWRRRAEACVALACRSLRKLQRVPTRASFSVTASALAPAAAAAATGSSPSSDAMREDQGAREPGLDHKMMLAACMCCGPARLLLPGGSTSGIRGSIRGVDSTQLQQQHSVPATRSISSGSSAPLPITNAQHFNAHVGDATLLPWPVPWLRESALSTVSVAAAAAAAGSAAVGGATTAATATPVLGSSNSGNALISSSAAGGGAAPLAHSALPPPASSSMLSAALAVSPLALPALLQLGGSGSASATIAAATAASASMAASIHASPYVSVPGASGPLWLHGSPALCAALLTLVCGLRDTGPAAASSSSHPAHFATVSPPSAGRATPATDRLAAGMAAAPQSLGSYAQHQRFQQQQVVIWGRSELGAAALLASSGRPATPATSNAASSGTGDGSAAARPAVSAEDGGPAPSVQSPPPQSKQERQQSALSPTFRRVFSRGPQQQQQQQQRPSPTPTTPAASSESSSPFSPGSSTGGGGGGGRTAASAAAAAMAPAVKDAARYSMTSRIIHPSPSLESWIGLVVEDAWQCGDLPLALAATAAAVQCMHAMTTQYRSDAMTASGVSLAPVQCVFKLPATTRVLHSIPTLMRHIDASAAPAAGSLISTHENAASVTSTVSASSASLDAASTMASSAASSLSLNYVVTQQQYHRRALCASTAYSLSQHSLLPLLRSILNGCVLYSTMSPVDAAVALRLLAAMSAESRAGNAHCGAGVTPSSSSASPVVAPPDSTSASAAVGTTESPGGGILEPEGSSSGTRSLNNFELDQGTGAAAAALSGSSALSSIPPPPLTPTDDVQGALFNGGLIEALLCDACVVPRALRWGAAAIATFTAVHAAAAPPRRGDTSTSASASDTAVEEYVIVTHPSSTGSNSELWEPSSLLSALSAYALWSAERSSGSGGCNFAASAGAAPPSSAPDRSTAVAASAVPSPPDTSQPPHGSSARESAAGVSPVRSVMTALQGFYLSSNGSPAPPHLAPESMSRCIPGGLSFHVPFAPLSSALGPRIARVEVRLRLQPRIASFAHSHTPMLLRLDAPSNAEYYRADASLHRLLASDASLLVLIVHGGAEPEVKRRGRRYVYSDVPPATSTLSDVHGREPATSTSSVDERGDASDETGRRSRGEAAAPAAASGVFVAAGDSGVAVAAPVVARDFGGGSTSTIDSGPFRPSAALFNRTAHTRGISSTSAAAAAGSTAAAGVTGDSQQPNSKTVYRDAVLHARDSLVLRLLLDPRHAPSRQHLDRGQCAVTVTLLVTSSHPDEADGANGGTTGPAKQQQRQYYVRSQMVPVPPPPSTDLHSDASDAGGADDDNGTGSGSCAWAVDIDVPVSELLLGGTTSTTSSAAACVPLTPSTTSPAELLLSVRVTSVLFILGSQAVAMDVVVFAAAPALPSSITALLSRVLSQWDVQITAAAEGTGATTAATAAASAAGLVSTSHETPLMLLQDNEQHVWIPLEDHQTSTVLDLTAPQHAAATAVAPPQQQQHEFSRRRSRRAAVVVDAAHSHGWPRSRGGERMNVYGSSWGAAS